ncbi:MAG: undecaprenyldiphospho-muramoylpentapeptide beta-N-acetylglucosaminyltransferase [Bacteroidetes bacterium]|nr:undecaprenyldiphospho-muramoylpentapeptide beta-N-acetylglucosaminyltransferase [Bacteroidota bacterium]
MKILMSGGGTGGHVFPGIAIAEAIRQIMPESEIVFAGTSRGPESTVVPKYGFEFRTIRISGFNRSNWKKNLTFPIELMKGLLDSWRILRAEKPDAVVATGGYVCGPVTWLAQRMGIPTFVQEQNAYAGFTSRLLGRGATRTFITYDISRRQFPSAIQDRIRCYGNPVRQSFPKVGKPEAARSFGLSGKKRVILVIGGSLGAKSINLAVQSCYQYWLSEGWELIWQTGKSGVDLPELSIDSMGSVWRQPFIDRMGEAYQAADLVISRAGATSLAEITVFGKPSVLVPYPWAADDHQTANAKVLEAAGAAVLIPDQRADSDLRDTVIRLISQKGQLEKMSAASLKAGQPDAAKQIAQEIITVLNRET